VPPPEAFIVASPGLMLVMRGFTIGLIGPRGGIRLFSLNGGTIIYSGDIGILFKI
jgi:hypothetical protein